MGGQIAAQTTNDRFTDAAPQISSQREGPQWAESGPGH
ncbi:hypothetical protein Z945_3439 [Sulfitobacter noctilucae]|nr:hypothetical protein Z945_3439 [Sulfitobacter noctilucae]